MVVSVLRHTHMAGSGKIWGHDYFRYSTKIIRIIWKINGHSAQKRQDLARLTECRLMRFEQICAPLNTPFN
jgi:hypothetical protein